MQIYKNNDEVNIDLSTSPSIFTGLHFKSPIEFKKKLSFSKVSTPNCKDAINKFDKLSNISEEAINNKGLFQFSFLWF